MICFIFFCLIDENSKECMPVCGHTFQLDRSMHQYMVRESHMTFWYLDDDNLRPFER